MVGLPRLRQVALVARDFAAVVDELQMAFGEPFRDPGVGEFGLENAVFAVGDTFLEVVSPIRDGTTAGRYLDRRGCDSGYMAIFQVPDVHEARRRAERAGVRIVWQSDRANIAGTHLHPKDVPGAIVSLDWADPAESWAWAGPRWTGAAPTHDNGQAPTHDNGGIAGLAVEVEDPVFAAGRWATLLGLRAEGATVRLEDAGQVLRFAPAGPRGEGITDVLLEAAGAPKDIGGVRFSTTVEF